MKKTSSVAANKQAKSKAERVSDLPTGSLSSVSPDIDNHRIFGAIDTYNRQFITSRQFWEAVGKMGIQQNDPRLQRVHQKLNSIAERIESDKKISLADFEEILNGSALIRKALIGDLCIPDFSSFCQDIEDIYDQTRTITDGKVADYIPQLARVNPEYYAISICTIDGQRFSLGDADVNFCLQSTCKPINYCLISEELGPEKVHQHVGREPSGMVFNELSLNSRGLPHNPLINAGAIMACSLLRRNQEISDRFDYVTQTWQELTGGTKPNFNNSVYLSERQTADRNFALAYFMRENKAFPPDTDLVETLEFYFQCCSMELNTDALSIAAATLANAGICPVTDKKIFSATTIQNCLSLMYSCGMYDFSGEFAFEIGLPAKSGVSGALMVVIPKLMGICIWSPLLDHHGNTVKGIEFCNQLVKHYNFHNYDILSSESVKKDPRRKKYESRTKDVVSMIWAATFGDLDEIQKLEATGVDLSVADYDGRTPLHLAAAEGRLPVVRYLIKKQVEINPRDRWGGTPLKDAFAGHHDDVVAYLREHGGRD